MTTAPTERELLQELVACRDWIDALPKDVTEARYFIAKQEAAVREVELWKQVRAHLAERPGEAVDEIVPLKSEHWIKRLATMYGCRQMAMLRGDAAGKKHCTFWLMQIADEHWHEIVNTLQSVTPAEPARGTVDVPVEPTEAMVHAAFRGFSWSQDFGVDAQGKAHKEAVRIYKAMLAARNG